MDTMDMDDARLRRAYEIADEELEQAFDRTVAWLGTDESVASVPFLAAMEDEVKAGRRALRLMRTQRGRMQLERVRQENPHIVAEIRRAVAYQRTMLESISPPPAGHG